MRIRTNLCGHQFLEITNGIVWTTLYTDFFTKSIVDLKFNKVILRSGFWFLLGLQVDNDDDE